jgi:hypothetical protein
LKSVLVAVLLPLAALASQAASAARPMKIDCAVRHVEPPRDTPLATVTKTTVHVFVLAAQDGCVLSAAVVDQPPPPFVSDLAEEAARRWRFCQAPHGSPVQRLYPLTFDFDGSGMTDLPSYQLMTLEDPLHVHVRHLFSVVSRLPPAESAPACQVHRVPMSVAIVPIAYGLPEFPSSRLEISRLQQFRRERETLFPNARRYVLGGCNVQLERMAETYVCHVCRTKRREWFRLHPGYERYE